MNGAPAPDPSPAHPRRALTPTGPIVTLYPHDYTRLLWTEAGTTAVIHCHVSVKGRTSCVDVFFPTMQPPPWYRPPRPPTQ